MSITLNFELNIRMSWYGSVIIIIIIILLSFCCCLFIRDSANCKLVRGVTHTSFSDIYLFTIYEVAILTWKQSLECISLQIFSK